jgi:CubicO group peptidase (beta-lactamase class C family)
LEYGDKNHFSRISSEVGEWEITHGGYRLGYANIHFTARDTAKFGQLYLDRDIFDSEQVLPAQWVEDSLKTYSTDA